MMRWTWDTQDLWIDPARLVAAGHSTKFTGTSDDDHIIGTEGRDTFRVYQGGNDVLRGEDGRDTFDFRDTFTLQDRVNGGAGSDKLLLGGQYDGAIELSSLNVKHIEVVKLDGGGSLPFELKLDGEFGDLRLDGLDAGMLKVDASELTSGRLAIFGGGYADQITGGVGDDQIFGSTNVTQGQLETLTGGSGSDKFIYGGAFDSPANSAFGSPDLITDFSREDVIILPTLGTSTYQINGGDKLGDITITYDSVNSRTEVRLVAEEGSTGEMLILLSGEHLDLSVVHGNHLVI